MTIKPAKIFGALLLMGVMAGANAASISLVATSPVTDVGAGDTVSFDIVMDFTDIPTLGGGFDVVFDSSALQFESFVSAGLGDPAFGREPDIFDGLLESAAFADFNGLSGPALVATVTFTALPTIVGSSAIVSTQGTMGDGGPFVSAIDFVSLIDVDYNSIEVVGVVPLPAAAWFMIGGLATLLGLRRKAA